MVGETAGRWGKLWHRSTAKQKWGFVLVLVNLAVLVFIAWSGGSQPIQTGQRAVLTLAGVAAQIAAAWLFASSGRPDKAFVRKAYRRLQTMGSRVAASRAMSERIYEGSLAPKERNRSLGQLSYAASVIEEDVVEALDDWAQIMVKIDPLWAPEVPEQPDEEAE